MPRSNLLPSGRAIEYTSSSGKGEHHVPRCVSADSARSTRNSIPGDTSFNPMGSWIRLTVTVGTTGVSHVIRVSCWGCPAPTSPDTAGTGHWSFLGHDFQLLNRLERGAANVILEDAVTQQSELTAFGRPTIRQQQVGRGLRGDLLMNQRSGEYFGNIGPIGDDAFCYQKGSTLYAVDPYSGDELWHIDKYRRGSEIFADDQYVVLAFRIPGEREYEAHVYRAADGEFVSKTELPTTLETNRQGADWGRYFLTRQAEAEGDTLAMFDPVTGRNIWERTFPKYHSWAPRDGHELVVLSEDGLVQVIRPEDGEIEFETQVELPDKLNGLSVLGLPDKWILFTRQGAGLARQSRALLPEQVEAVEMIHGPAFAFDRKTNALLWSRELPSQVVDPLLPGRWPFLVLAAMAREPDRPRGVGATYMNLLLIDQQTGETVYESEGSGRSRSVFWTVSEAEPKIELKFDLTELIVAFGGQEDRESNDDATSPPPQREPTRPTRRPPAPPPSEPPIGEEN